MSQAKLLVNTALLFTKGGLFSMLPRNSIKPSSDFYLQGLFKEACVVINTYPFLKTFWQLHA